jgi:hypothetical protein
LPDITTPFHASPTPQRSFVTTLPEPPSALPHTDITPVAPSRLPVTPSPTKKQRLNTYPPPIFSPGELGKLSLAYARQLRRLGWSRFFQTHHHQNIKSLHPHLRNLPHPAAPLLHRLASSGVPAPSQGPPWTIHQQDAAVQRGPHPSAGRQHATFLLEDMYNYVRAGYWLVLPYHALRGHPKLKIAPAGVVPQRERRPRPIMDYTYNGVNSKSVPLAPTDAMQFGGALQRILQHLAYANPTYGPPLMAKLDLSDGYYRIPLSAHAALELAVILPPDKNSGPLLGVPLSLPMGWSLSPPYFCLFTETVADLANTALTLDPQYPPLRMDHLPRQACPLEFHPTALWAYNMCPPQ